MKKLKTFSLYGGLFLIGTVFCLYYGRMGFAPFEQSIVFDGGWRILSGQIPFRDFVTPTAIPPIVMQAVFFKFFGVTWFAYCLHAALMNGAFVVLAYLFLKEFQCSSWLSVFYAGVSSGIYYTPIGVPYIQQHGFFFLLFAYVCFLKAVRSHQARYRFPIYIAFCCLNLVFAALCKQNVVLFGMLPLVGLFLAYRQQWRRILLWGTVSGAALFAVLAGGMRMAGMSWGKFVFYFFTLPSQLGHERFMLMGARLLRRLTFTETKPFYMFPFFHSPPLLLIAASVAGGTLLLWYVRRRAVPADVKRGLALILFAGSLTLACELFVLTTSAHPVSGYPFLYLGIGFFHIGILAMLQGRRHAILRFWITGCCVVFMGYEAYSVHKRSVENRGALQGVDFIPDKAVTLKIPALRWMRFLLAERYYKFTADELETVVQFFQENEGNFLLLGDTSILYGVTGRPSISPSLWFHMGLTFPEPLSPKWFEAWQDELLANMKRHHVEYLVIEQKFFQNTGIELFPKLVSYVDQRHPASWEIGEFMIVRLTDEEPE